MVLLRKGAEWIFEKQTTVSSYYHCSHGNCRARAKLIKSTSRFVVSGRHTHILNNLRQRRLETKFRRELRKRIEGSYRPPAAIYSEIAGEPRYREAAQRLTAQSLASSMYQWSRNRPLPHITRYSKMALASKSPKWSSLFVHSNTSLRVRYTSTAAGHKALVFIPNNRYINSIGIRTIHIGISNWSLPIIEETNNCLIIRANYHQYSVPVAWAITPNKSREILENILTVLQEEFGVNPNETIFTSPELIEIIREKFPRALVKLSFCETSIFILDKMYENNIDMTDVNNVNQLSKFLGLFLLPQANVNVSLLYLIDNMTEETLRIFNPVIEFLREFSLTLSINETTGHQDFDSFDDTFLSACQNLQAATDNEHQMQPFKLIKQLLNELEAGWQVYTKIKDRLPVNRSTKVRSCFDGGVVKLRNFWKWYADGIHTSAEVFIRLESIINVFVRNTCVCFNISHEMDDEDEMDTSTDDLNSDDNSSSDDDSDSDGDDDSDDEENFDDLNSSGSNDDQDGEENFDDLNSGSDDDLDEENIINNQGAPGDIEINNENNVNGGFGNNLNVDDDADAGNRGQDVEIDEQNNGNNLNGNNDAINDDINDDAGIYYQEDERDVVQVLNEENTTGLNIDYTPRFFSDTDELYSNKNYSVECATNNCENKAELMCLPCGHLLFCIDCVEVPNTCSTCNQATRELLKIFINDSNDFSGKCIICHERPIQMVSYTCNHAACCEQCTRILAQMSESMDSVRCVVCRQTCHGFYPLKLKEA